MINSITTKRNPMAEDLRQPKYKLRTIPDKKKPKPLRKEKHKGKRDWVSENDNH